MGKAARTTTPRSPIRGATPRHLWRWITAVAAVIAAIAALAIWQAGRSAYTAPVALTHVHGLGINPADGTLYMATHDGLYRLAGDGAANLVGQGHQDTMGFTIAGPNQFLGSGHPEPGQGGPPHLGLIESGDAGATWSTRSLAGRADFHALRYRHGTVYGFNSATGQLITSTDKVTWQTRAAMSLRDFDVSPIDPQILVATTEAGLQRSSDGGTTWAPAGGPSLLLLAWENTDQLWGLTTTGEVLRSADGGTSWNPTGKLAGQATAFTAHQGTMYAAVHERGIFSSTDNGTTWTARYVQS